MHSILELQGTRVQLIKISHSAKARQVEVTSLGSQPEHFNRKGWSKTPVQDEFYNTPREAM